MKQQAKIDNWKIMKHPWANVFVLVGQVKDHPNQDTFKTEVQMTSPLLNIDFKNKKAETMNTSYELLGEAKDENLNS